MLDLHLVSYPHPGLSQAKRVLEHFEKLTEEVGIITAGMSKCVCLAAGLKIG